MIASGDGADRLQPLPLLPQQPLGSNGPGERTDDVEYDEVLRRCSLEAKDDWSSLAGSGRWWPSPSWLLSLNSLKTEHRTFLIEEADWLPS